MSSQKRSKHFNRILFFNPVNQNHTSENTVPFCLSTHASLLFKWLTYTSNQEPATFVLHKLLCLQLSMQVTNFVYLCMCERMNVCVYVCVTVALSISFGMQWLMKALVSYWLPYFIHCHKFTFNFFTFCSVTTYKRLFKAVIAAKGRPIWPWITGTYGCDNQVSILLFWPYSEWDFW